jgi:CPA1 family monovalent cation:H+ antiporter
LTGIPNLEIIIAGLLGVMLIGSLVSRWIRLPYTIVLVIIGIILAASSASSVIGISVFYNNLLGSVFVGLVIPPLLFETMIGIRSAEFRSSIRVGLVLATAGVLVATVAGGLILWKIVGLPAYDSFLFSSLISPTDTASVLEIFRRLKVPKRLGALMDAEAAFNDATGIIVFSIILTTGSVSHLAFLHGILNFSFIFGGGVLIGLAVGFGAEIISSLINDTLSEAVLSISIVYGAYALASSLGFSGLVAVAITGLYYGNITMRSVVHPLSKEALRSFWRIMAFIANSVAFLFIGLNTDLLNLSRAFLLIIIASVSVFAARAVAVYPILTFFGRKRKVPRSWKNVALLGGMRGALSVVLIASIPVNLPLRSTLVTMVLGVVFISIIFQGPFLSSYIRRNFETEMEMEKEAAEKRLSRTMSRIEELKLLHENHAITEAEFAAGLEYERDKLTEIVSDFDSTLNIKEVVRSRARNLYETFVSIGIKRWSDRPGDRPDRGAGHEAEGEEHAGTAPPGNRKDRNG